MRRWTTTVAAASRDTSSGATVTLLPIAVFLVALALAGCGRLSGGGGGGGGVSALPVLPPLGEAPAGTIPTLISVVPDEDRVLVAWQSDDAEVDLALFHASTEDALYDGDPIATGLQGESLVVEGLAPGVAHVFGLAIAEETTLVPTGEPLSAFTLAPLYVDAAADPGVADGLTPATAFPSLLSGLLTAFVNGGANLWIAGGDYPLAALPIFEGVHLYGGFAPGFALAERDPEAFPTVLGAVPDEPLLTVENLLGTTVLDGLQLDGGGTASIGISITNSPVELRRIVVHDMKGPGLRIKAGVSDDPLAARLVDVTSHDNGSEGLAAEGSLALVVHGGRFDSNIQEGCDLDDLVADDGGEASVRFVDTRCAGNGSEGLDIDLVAPLAGGSEGGRFDVRLVNVRAELNGADGVLLDLDFDDAPAWHADLLLDGVVARANAGHGVRLDLDASVTAFVAHALCTANGADGIAVTSETMPSLTTVVASALVGNQGVGLRASEGNGTVVMAHGFVAGNVAGGLLAEDAEATVHSTVAWLQEAPWSGARVESVVDAGDPQQAPLERIPALYGWVTGGAPDSLVLSDAAADALPDAGAALELDDDGEPRNLSGFGSGTSISVEPEPPFLAPPTLITAFLAGDDVVEDYRVPPGSAAEGAGLAAPGLPAPDAGVLGAPGGEIPGVAGGGTPFRVSRVEPPITDGVGATQTISLLFLGGEPDAATAGATTVLVRDGTGTLLPSDPFVTEGSLQLPAPSGGWPAGPLSVEVLVGLTATDGTPLAAPVVLPLRSP